MVTRFQRKKNSLNTWAKSASPENWSNEHARSCLVQRVGFRHKTIGRNLLLLSML